MLKQQKRRGKRRMKSTFSLIVIVCILAMFLPVQPVFAEVDSSRFGEVLVSDSGTDCTIEQGNTSRNLAVSPNGTIYAVYQCNEGIRVAKSTDNGDSFAASVSVYESKYEAEIAVSSAGTVYVCWVEDNNIKLSKSTDDGATFSVPATVGPITLGEMGGNVHMATDGSFVYMIDSCGENFYSSGNEGDDFTHYDFNEQMVFSDVHVDFSTGDVIVQKDDPTIKYYKSTDHGATFEVAVVPGGSVMYSVGSIASSGINKYLLIAGSGTNFQKINLSTGVQTSPSIGVCDSEQGRSLSADNYGNVVTGYTNEGNVLFEVSNDMGENFGGATTVAASTMANAAINTTNGDVMFLYQKADGKVYMKVYAGLLTGYTLNVSNSNLFFDADINDLNKTVTITNVSGDTITINDITVEGAFTIDRSDIGESLAAGTSGDIDVTYVPPESGTHTGKVIISNGENPDRIVFLTGTKTAQALEAPVLQSAVAGDRCVTLTWSAAEGSNGYKVYASTTSDSYTIPANTVAGSVYSCDVTELTNGTIYYFVVRSTSIDGDSVNSNELSATPQTVPDAPTNVSATAGNGKATVTFTAPTDNGGSPITGYIVTSNPGSITATGTGETITVTGLQNGITYTFTVKAINAVGNGAESAVSNAVTPYTPISSTTHTTPTTQTEPTKPAENYVEIQVNGKAETVATASTIKVDGKTVITVTVDDKK